MSLMYGDATADCLQFILSYAFDANMVYSYSGVNFQNTYNTTNPACYNSNGITAE